MDRAKKRLASPAPGLMKESIRTRVTFWLDIYCVPVGENTQDLRERAIAQMTPTYALAQYVLVLDSELQRVRPEQQGFAERMAVLAVCGWQTRCWTHQEGSLARKTVYQCSGHCLNTIAQDNFDNLRPTETSLVRELSLMASFAALYSTTGDPGSDFLRAWNSLLNKSSTQMQDALGIFGNLVGFSAIEMSHLSAKEHMKAILGAYSILPVDLLFADIRRHFTTATDENGRAASDLDRWIPQFPRGHHRLVSIDNTKLQVTPRGLLLDPSSALLRLRLHIGRELTHFTFAHKCSLYWVSLKTQKHDAWLKSGGSDIILILLKCPHKSWEMFHGRGACFIPLAEEETSMNVMYCCPVEYGEVTDEIDGLEFQVSCPIGAEANADNGTGILIRSGMYRSVMSYTIYRAI